MKTIINSPVFCLEKIFLCSLVLFTLALSSPANAGQLLDRCNSTHRGGTPDAQAAGLVNCYLDKMREIKHERDYIGRLEQAGIAVRGERRNGTGHTYSNCGIVWKKTYVVDPRVNENGICADKMNKHLQLRNDYYYQYCNIGRSGAFGTELWSILQKSNAMSENYKACFSANIVRVLSEDDLYFSPILGRITDRNSFIAVLKAARKRYLDNKMDQQHRDLVTACNAVMSNLQSNFPGAITKYSLKGCRV